MAYYDLSKQERIDLVKKMTSDIRVDLENTTKQTIVKYFSDEDTYIRKNGYLIIGKLFCNNEFDKSVIIKCLSELHSNENEKIRQTVVNAFGEIGKTDFLLIEKYMDVSLFDEHHSVRNAVIGSIKKMGQKNPVPVLLWAKKYLSHPDKEVRREVCHGIELRGRTHPQDILPLLKKLEFDKTKRVTSTLVHVLGQIAYKKGCLETVISDLNNWKNKDLVFKAIEEIIDVHNRYKNFSFYNQEEAINYIEKNFKN